MIGRVEFYFTDYTSISWSTSNIDNNMTYLSQTSKYT